MKVYVIKNPKGEYMTETRDFINSIWQATLFNDVETAWCYAPNDCRVYECIFMERDASKEHDKQVRKQVCEEMWKEFEQRLMNKKEDMPVMKVANMINSVLDKMEELEKGGK